MSDTATTPRTRLRTERPRLHKVILVNDDHTLHECVVAVFTKDVAKAEATRATGAARRQGYPLLFTTEPER